MYVYVYAYVYAYAYVCMHMCMRTCMCMRMCMCMCMCLCMCMCVYVYVHVILLTELIKQHPSVFSPFPWTIPPAKQLWLGWAAQTEEPHHRAEPARSAALQGQAPENQGTGTLIRQSVA